MGAGQHWSPILEMIMPRSCCIAACCLALAACTPASPVIDEQMMRIDGEMPADLSGSWERDYSRGDDVVRQNGNEQFEEDVQRQNYRLGLSQVMRPDLILALNYNKVWITKDQVISQ